MSTDIAIVIFASDRDYRQAGFGPGAFGGQVGKEIQVGTAVGTLVSATISPDGSSAVLQLRMDDAVAEEWMRPRLTGRVDEHAPIEHPPGPASLGVGIIAALEDPTSRPMTLAEMFGYDLTRFNAEELTRIEALLERDLGESRSERTER